MRNSLWSKVAVVVLLVAVGFTLVSGQTGQVTAAGHHGHWGGGGGWRWGWGSWGWYYPSYYSYPLCGYGYYYNSCSNYYGTNYYGALSQYQLTVNTNPTGVSGQTSGGGAYNSGSTASFSAQSVIQASSNIRYVLKGWSGDYSGSDASGSIAMTSSKTVTAMYQAQYLLTLSAQPGNAPAPQNGGWYNAGDSVPLTAAQTVGGNDGSRLLFNGWSVDGGQPGSAGNVLMNAPHTVVAVYKQQYYLTVNSDQGATSGSGWYDAGSNAPISVSNPGSPSFGVNLVFNGWQGAGVQSQGQSSQVMVDAPKTVTATWRADSTVLYATIGLVILAILLVAGAAFYTTTQRRQETTQETTQTETDSEQTSRGHKSKQ